MRNLPVLVALAALGVTANPTRAQQFVATEIACTVSEVAANASLVHVYCSAGGGVANLGSDSFFVVRYFAVAVDDPLAPHLVAIGTTALQSQRQISVSFDPNPSANPPGCLASDCRRALAIKGYGG